MIKHLILAIVLSFLTINLAPTFAQINTTQTTTIKWHTDYDEAISAAKQQKKHLLLFFTGSDWCGWCKKMQQEIFESPEFAHEAGNHFIFQEVDFPMNTQLPPKETQQNAMLKKKYGISGYPTIIILDSDENFIGEAGYRPGGGKAYAQYIKQLVSPSKGNGNG